MNLEKYFELYAKYSNKINQPVNLKLNNQRSKKAILKNISCLISKTQYGDDYVQGIVELQDLETMLDFQFDLLDFEQVLNPKRPGKLELIDLHKKAQGTLLYVGKYIRTIEIFHVQLKSHLGKKKEDWSKIAKHLIIDINLQNEDFTTYFQDRIELATIMENGQRKPIFEISKHYELRYDPKSSKHGSLITFSLVETARLLQDYEITLWCLLR